MLVLVPFALARIPYPIYPPQVNPQILESLGHKRERECVRRPGYGWSRSFIRRGALLLSFGDGSNFVGVPFGTFFRVGGELDLTTERRGWTQGERGFGLYPIREYPSLTLSNIGSPKCHSKLRNIMFRGISSARDIEELCVINMGAS